ncbi:MAG: alpha/beta hydrolase [Candidatus Rokubacteria bacterium]|nr:alpha/beta hydrolase [Candidatus Rokubacteria bacterium]
METERVRVGGLTLAVRVWGDARAPITAFAAHGLTANHTCWEPLVEALVPDVRLVAWDLRGRGDSDKPATGYSLAAHSADLEGLMDNVGVRRAAVLGHSLGAHIGVWFAAHRPERVDRLVLVDGGFDVRAEVFDSLAPSLARLEVEFPSLGDFLDRVRGLPMFAGRWNAFLERYFTYDVAPTPSGGVRSKVSRAAVEEEVANLARTRLWALHHRIQAPTLLLRAPEGLLRDDDCLMTQAEAEARAAAEKAAAARAAAAAKDAAAKEKPAAKAKEGAPAKEGK